MKIFVYQSIVVFVFFCVSVQIESAETKCADCWSPSLSFDIESRGIEQTLIFISGYGYALNNVNTMLSAKEQNNYFCNEGQLIGSQELVMLLNETLSGEVTAEQVSAAITYKLAEKYPCNKTSHISEN